MFFLVVNRSMELTYVNRILDKVIPVLEECISTLDVSVCDIRKSIETVDPKGLEILLQPCASYREVYSGNSVYSPYDEVLNRLNFVLGSLKRAALDHGNIMDSSGSPCSERHESKIELATKNLRECAERDHKYLEEEFLKEERDGGLCKVYCRYLGVSVNITHRILKCSLELAELETGAALDSGLQQRISHLIKTVDGISRSRGCRD